MVILTRNEFQAINVLFNKIPIKQLDQVFVVDGQSTDGTIEFFRKKKVPVFVQDKLGRGEAFRLGLKKSRCNNVIFFSPDGNEDPKDILRIQEYLEKGNDLVVASRFMSGARADDALELVPYRGWGNKFFTMLANVAFCGQMTDSINGFRGCKKEKILGLNLDAQGFAIEYQMSMRAMKRKLQIKEFPTFEGDRIGGQSGAKSIPTGLYFIKIFLRELFIGNKF